jgi:hypothetical protein
LCPTCHTKIDKDANNYPVDLLRQWKAEHEDWVARILIANMPQVSFAELEQVARGLLHPSFPLSDDFTVTPPNEKLDRNGLGTRTRLLLNTGLAIAPEVSEFIQRSNEYVDPNFGDRLAAAFTQKYAEERASGLTGDALYSSLATFAAPPGSDLVRQAAGYAVLAYLFETCDVFEK